MEINLSKVTQPMFFTNTLNYLKILGEAIEICFQLKIVYNKQNIKYIIQLAMNSPNLIIVKKKPHEKFLNTLNKSKLIITILV